MKCGDDEEIVYRDNLFMIVRFTSPEDEGGFAHEVIPIDSTGSRLDDLEICPEPALLEDAIKLMEQKRPEIIAYLRKSGGHQGLFGGYA